MRGRVNKPKIILFGRKIFWQNRLGGRTLSFIVQGKPHRLGNERIFVKVLVGRLLLLIISQSLKRRVQVAYKIYKQTYRHTQVHFSLQHSMIESASFFIYKFLTIFITTNIKSRNKSVNILCNLLKILYLSVVQEIKPKQHQDNFRVQVWKYDIM